MTVVGQNTGPVKGSLVWNAATNTAEFVQTSGALAPDNYTVTLASRSNGWVSVAGNELLDGNDDLVPGGNYVTTFSVASSSTPVLRVPDFARGPGQSVNVSDTAGTYGTAVSNYLPVSLSNTAGGARA